MKAQVITIANNKGGVGKTTAVVNIGASLALRGYKTLLVDLDSQNNLTGTFREESTVNKTVFQTLTTGEALPVLKVKDRLSLVPASIELANIDIVLQNVPERERILEKALSGAVNSYDFILLDTPPALGLCTISALRASSGVLVPLTAEGYSYKGLNTLYSLVMEMQKGMCPGLRLLGMFLNRYEGRKVNRLIEEALKASFPGALLETRIHNNIAIVETSLLRRDIFSKPQCRGARDYSALTSEILGKLNYSEYKNQKE